MPEVELKFAISPKRFAGVAAEAESGSDRVPMTAVYFDSPDRCLSAAGVSLRLRLEGAKWIQTVKAPGRGPADRDEHNAPRTAASLRGRRFAPDLSLHAGTPAGHALQKALRGRDAEGASLEEVFRTEVIRHRRTCHAGDAEVEVALDAGEIVAAGRRQAIQEIEFELKHGSAAGLFALARQWVDRHALWIEGRSKAERGGWLSRGEPGGPPRKAAREEGKPIQQAASERELLREIIRSVLTQVIANASEVASGRATADHVHQLRVGLRRLRTALRAFGEIAPELLRCEPALADVFRTLGAWRDAGVVRESIAPKLRDVGAPFVDLPRTGDERLSPRTLVRATTFQLALLDLMQFVMEGAANQDEPTDADSHDKPLDALIAARLAKLHKQIRCDGRRFETLAEDEQHRVRKRLKRLRYLVEFVAPRYKRRAVKRYLAALEPAQDALGSHNDEVVAIGRYRAAAEANPGAWFAVGWLTARLEDSANSCRLSLKAIDDAERFWR